MERPTNIHHQINYESDGLGSYLVLKLDKDECILEYQMEMMMNNDIQSLLVFNMRQKDAHRYLYYNVTSKLQLKQLLNRRRLKKGEVVGILIEIIQGILEGSNYLLRHENYFLEEDYIFIHPESLQISLFYVPCRMNQRNINTELRQLINRLMGSVELQQEISDNFLVKILYELNKDNFNLKTFLRVLRELQEDSFRDPEQRIESLNNFSKSNEVESWEKKEEIKIAPDNDRKEKILLHKDNRQEVAATIDDGELGHSMRSKLMIFLWEALILIVGTFIFLETSILINPSTGKLDKLSIIGVVILAGVINVLLIKRLWSKENLNTKKENVKSPSLIMNKKEIINVPKKLSFPIREHEAKNYYNPGVELGPFDTEILHNKNSAPHLISKGGGMEEKIGFNRDPFIIGKLRDQVDFVINNETISRVHAEIRCIDGNYHIKDLNSRNGTFLNGKQINSNIDYILNHGDQVAFSDSKYIFQHKIGDE